MLEPDDLLDEFMQQFDAAIDQGDEPGAKRYFELTVTRIPEVLGPHVLEDYRRRCRLYVEHLLATGHDQVRAENFDAVFAIAERARMTAAAIGEEDLVAAALGQAGYTQHRTGRHEQALATLEEARARAVKADDPITLASIENNIGLALITAGRHSLALAHVEEALRLARSAGVRTLETTTLNNRAYLARQLGRLEEAEAGYAAALGMARATGEVSDIRAGLVNLGFLDQLRGDLAAAQARFEEAREVAAMGGDRQGVRIAINLLAGIAAERSDYEAAEYLYEQALASAVEVGDREAERSAVHQLAYIAGARGEREKEIQLIQEAKRIAEEIGDYRGRLMALSFLGGALGKQGKPEEARSVLEEVRKLARDKVDVRFQSEAAANLGKLHLEAGEVASGLELLKEALDLADAFALSASSEQAEAEVFSRAADVTVDFALACHRQASASPPQRRRLLIDSYGAVERARGRDLRRALLLSDRLEAGGIDRAEVATLAGLTAQARALEARWRAASRLGRDRPRSADENLAALETEARLARERLAAHRDRLTDHDPAVQQLLEPDVPALEEIQASLAPNQAILSFALNEEAGLGTAFLASGFATFEIPGAQVLTPFVRALAAAGSDPRASYLPYAHALFRPLMIPALRFFRDHGLKIEDLFIVPDGDLHLVPFSLLLTEDPDTGTQAQPPDPDPGEMPLTADVAALRTWLSTKHVGPAVDFSKLPYLDRLIPLLRVVPSLDLAVRLANEGDRDSAECFDQAACLIGDPMTIEGRAALTAASSELEAITEAILATPEENIRWARTDLASHTLTGKRCTRDELLKRFTRSSPAARRPSYYYLHFATHGALNDRQPELSGLELTPRDGVKDVWRVPDILANPFDARLVVASACNTARGRYVPGSGVSSLTQAFLLAGARSVVSSLWSVPDKETAQLMRAFYTRMAAGDPPGRALTSSAAELRRNPSIRPYHWAGFVTSG